MSDLASIVRLIKTSLGQSNSPTLNEVTIHVNGVKMGGFSEICLWEFLSYVDAFFMAKTSPHSKGNQKRPLEYSWRASVVDSMGEMYPSSPFQPSHKPPTHPLPLSSCRWEV